VSGERDLGRLLAGLDPRPDPEEWVFVAVAEVPDGVAPLMTFREAEALTCIVGVGEARRAGLPDAPVFRRITLGVHSSLEAVGLTAAVASALAEAGMSANVVAAWHHDHVFVPADRAEAALERLRRLGH
jgi:uncharacterized protein